MHVLLVCSEGDGDPMTATLQMREAVRKAIMQVCCAVLCGLHTTVQGSIAVLSCAVLWCCQLNNVECRLFVRSAFAYASKACCAVHLSLRAHSGQSLLLTKLPCLMQGSIPDALEQLQQQCPLVLHGHSCSDEVQFHLRCQQYIEYIRYISS